MVSFFISLVSSERLFMGLYQLDFGVLITPNRVNFLFLGLQVT